MEVLESFKEALDMLESTVNEIHDGIWCVIYPAELSVDDAVLMTRKIDKWKGQFFVTREDYPSFNEIYCSIELTGGVFPDNKNGRQGSERCCRAPRVRINENESRVKYSNYFRFMYKVND